MLQEAPGPQKCRQQGLDTLAEFGVGATDAVEVGGAPCGVFDLHSSHEQVAFVHGTFVLSWGLSSHAKSGADERSSDNRRETKAVLVSFPPRVRLS
jgi:hypothetical protein